ncbi:MAG: ABC transporter permease [Pseudomonadales bacterium]|jgi:ABC-type lipoprotein release transport system permease subunit|nr:ABC transporter permease [Pseudomonadales bacterium]MDP7145470.1 ABC transporter permease [Pseudomonadales bacterium]MDP7359288.1 ABC transporter permease [Pseudomonadales bacterium]MDP7597802.1 ABC transporter permease [Pseudomonadales bacterium]HJN52979.1 FtsX-like permease family protein [Pseudomonadales bacterium]|tara:strand:- start:1848 stop:3071 length:1224 start_codon:yes stop_codon:yes gene_type:complete
MLLTFRLAYRNLFRNTRRTVLTCLLISCSLAALMLVDGLIIGMLKVMVDTTTKTFAGEAQVHRQGFLDSFDSDLYMSDTKSIEAVLAADKRVAGYSVRTVTGGMISSANNMTGGLIYGVSADREAGVSRLKEAIIKGKYFTGNETEILIGEDMADLLEVKLGDRLVATLAEVDGGDLSQALFRLSGIFRFGMREIDKGLVFIPLDKSREILGMQDGGHEVAIQFFDATDAANPDLPLFQKLSDGDIEAVGWPDFFPQIQAMVEMVDYATLIVGIVLFLLASFGVINSMFMSIYERIYEFGVVKAIGTQPKQLVQLILMEALVLGLFSVILGLLLGGLSSYYFSIHGMAIGEFEFEGINLADRIKTELTFAQFINFPIYVLLLTIAASIYPARFAARIIPSVALQRSL